MNPIIGVMFLENLKIFQCSNGKTSIFQCNNNLEYSVHLVHSIYSVQELLLQGIKILFVTIYFINRISSSEHSTCEMYATIDYDYNNNLNNNTTDRKIINCNTDWGWDYIRDDYTETMVTQFQWVCDKKSYATQAFTLFGLGKGIGTVIFGYAGDK